MKIHTEENMLRNGDGSCEKRRGRDSSWPQSAQIYDCGGSPQRLAPTKTNTEEHLDWATSMLVLTSDRVWDQSACDGVAPLDPS